jgi:putative inorganic carbon (HCO3(-)) transporter
MNGSLFFRGIAFCMDFLRDVAAGSFIAGLFTADYNEKDIRESFTGRMADKLLNGLPRWLTPPEFLPGALSRPLSGSLLIGGTCDALNTPVPGPGTKVSPAAILQWVLYAAPVWGLCVLVAAAPFLPTMVLAGGLVLVFLLTLCSRRFIIEPVTLAVLLFIFVTLFAGVTSFHTATSIPIALLTSVLMLSLPLVTACCTVKKQVDFFFFVFLASAFFVGLVGLYQSVTGRMDMTWVDSELFGHIQFRIIATFGNPNVYGTYLLLAVPLCAALALYVKKPLYKLCAAGVTGLLLINLLLTYSRGCYLALAFALLIFILLAEKRLIVLSMAGIFLLPFVLPPSVIDRVLSITNFADSSTSYRIFIWQGTLRIVRDYWMTGLGQGIEAYNVIYPYYAFNAVVAPHSHNLFLQVLVETGIVGLTVFVGMLAVFFRSQAMFLRRARDWRNRVVCAAMVAAAVGFLFQGIFDHVFYNYRVMLIFFMFMGLACAFARTAEPPRSEA